MADVDTCGDRLDTCLKFLLRGEVIWDLISRHIKVWISGLSSVLVPDDQDQSLDANNHRGHLGWLVGARRFIGASWTKENLCTVDQSWTLAFPTCNTNHCGYAPGD